MILGIKTDSPVATLMLGSMSGDVKVENSWTAGRKLSGELLKEIELLLSKKGLEPNNLTGIVVYSGPGSFTGLRIGVTVANTMAYSLNIPIVASTGEAWFSVGMEKLKTGNQGKIVVPEYGGEPNITQPRK